MAGIAAIFKILTYGAFLLFAGADTVGHLSSRLIQYMTVVSIESINLVPVTSAAKAAFSHNLVFSNTLNL